MAIAAFEVVASSIRIVIVIMAFFVVVGGDGH